MGLKRGAIGNAYGEHIENLENIVETHWELDRNIEGTCWDRRKKTEIKAL
jgi:hypothetical protein